MPETFPSVPPVKHDILALAAAIAVLGIGCARSPVPQPQSPQDRAGAAKSSGDRSPPLADRPTFLAVYAPGLHTFDYQSQATVESSQADTLRQVDSIRVQARLTLTISQVDNQTARAVVRADSLRVRRIGASARVDTVLTEAQQSTRQIHLPSGKVRHAASDFPSCTLNQPALLVGDDWLPTIAPSSLLAQRSWSDTVSYVICRGAVRFTANRVARYQVLGREPATSAGDSITLLLRTSDVSLRGEGVQWEQPVRAAGTGFTVDTITLRRGRLASISAHSQLDLGFRSSVKEQRFIQRAHVTIVLRQ